jgi:hypothetical protein
MGNFLSSFPLNNIKVGVCDFEKALHLLQNCYMSTKFVVKKFELFVLNDFGVIYI